MHLAAGRGHLDVLKLLQETGSDQILQAKDGSGSTPLHQAAAQGQLEVVEWLLKQGVSQDLPDLKGKRPLDRASEEGQVQVMEYLEQVAGAGSSQVRYGARV